MDALRAELKACKFHRKVIQMCSYVGPDANLILAVCNDGTLWSLHDVDNGSFKWESFPSPPQP